MTDLDRRVAEAMGWHIDLKTNEVFWLDANGKWQEHIELYTPSTDINQALAFAKSKATFEERVGTEIKIYDVPDLAPSCNVKVTRRDKLIIDKDCSFDHLAETISDGVYKAWLDHLDDATLQALEERG